MGVILSYLKDDILNPELQLLFIHTMLHLYFYEQYDELRIDHQLRPQIIECNKLCNKYYIQFKQLMNMTNQDLLILMRTDLFDFYNKVRDNDNRQLAFIEYETIEQWLIINFPDDALLV